MSISAELGLPMDFFSNNKDKESFYLSDDAIDAFNFKYISSDHFKHIIEDVKKQRMRKKEETIWSSYLCNEDSERSDFEEGESGDEEISKLKQILRDSEEDEDQELERLKEDALPERKKTTSKKVANKKKESKLENGRKATQIALQMEENTAGSTNLLLTIPEERNCSPVYERSPISRLECSSRTKKTHSERTLRPHSEASNKLHRISKDMDYNYSSEMSELYDSDDDENGDVRWNVRAHPAVAHKIFSLQKRISELLDEIAFRLGRIPLPDGDRDLRRREQCVMEFAIRFSRNYLYDLGRQIGDIQRHLRAISPNARVKPTRRGVSLHVQAIEQKLTSAHQLLLHALNAYCKHIPSSVLKGQPGKLKEVLQIVVDLKEICGKIHLTTEFYGCGDVEPPPLGKNTENRCRAILSKLRGSSDNESELVSHTTQSTVIKGQRNEKRGNRIENSNALPTRLSMYSVDPRLTKIHGNKRALSAGTKQKRKLVNIAGKTGPERHPSTPQQPNSSPVTCKSSKAIVRREKTKIRSPQKEDEISTMMSTLPTDSDMGSSVTVSKYSVLIDKSPGANTYFSQNSPPGYSRIAETSVKDEQLVDDVTTNAANRITDEQLSSLVPVIADLMTLVKSQNEVAIRPVSSDSIETVMDLLKKCQSSNEQKIEPGLSSIVDNMENSRKRSAKIASVTQRRVDNMRLICLPSGEEIRGKRESVDSENDTRKCEGETERLGEGTSSKTNEATLKCSKPRNVLRVDESLVESLMKYRDEYQCYIQTNPMYTSKSQNKPWDVVAWIADKLVDELVVDVSKEFQMDAVIRNLFELEFKEF